MEGGLFLFLGSDRARKLQQIHTLQHELRVGPLDRHDLDGASVSAADLLVLCRQRPASGLRRLITLDHAQRLPHEAVEALRHHARTIAQTACVVLLVELELSVRHPLTQAAHDGVVQVQRFAGGQAPSAKPFALVDAMGARDLTGSLKAVREQCALGKEPTDVLALVAWQVQRWVTVRRLLDAGVPPPRIAVMAGMRAWQIERVRAEIAGRSRASLQRALTRCWRLEVDLKSGRAPPWPALEQFVMELCRPA